MSRTLWKRVVALFFVLSLFAPFSQASADDPPILTLNGAVQNVTAAHMENVTFQYPSGAEVAIWYDYQYVGGCAGTPNDPGWTTEYAGNINLSGGYVAYLQARWIDTLETSECLRIDWLVPEQPTATPTETPSETPTETPSETPTETPTGGPVLTLNEGVENVTVPGGTYVYFTWPDGAEVAIWNSMNGATDCSGPTEAGWRTDYSGNSVWVSGITLWYQARWIADPGVTSPCLSATWSDSATETPTATATSTPTGGPVLTLNDGTTSIEVPDYTFVYFTWPDGAEVAIWNSWDGATGCTGTPSGPGWTEYYGGSSIYTAPTTVWYQARWIAEPDVTSPCLSATWSANATETPTATATSTPTGGPVLTLNEGVENVTVPGGTYVYFTWPDGAEVAIWNSLNGATDCSGTPENSWRTDYAGNSVWVNGVTLWYQARWIADPEVTSPCLSATWSDSATETPTATATATATATSTVTPIGGPVLTLNGGTTSIEVPDYTFVYFTWPDGAEVAIWNSWDGATGCTGTPSGPGWTTAYGGNSIYTAPTTLWYQARWIADPDVTSPCLSASWVLDAPTETVTPTATVTSTATATATATSTATATVTPIGGPVLTLNGGVENVTVPGGTYVYFTWPDGAEVAIWNSLNGSTGCSGATEAGWRTDYQGNSVWVNGVTLWYQARWIADPGVTSPCLSATWSDSATETPTVTSTPVTGPILLINGAANSITVPSAQFVYFNWSTGSEVAIWNSLYGATGCSGPTEAGWRTDYHGNSVWIAGVTLWYQARWIDDPTVTSPCLSVTWTSNPNSVTETIVRIEVPEGVSLEGAPFALFAPTASQIAMGAYVEGVVGPDNTIVLFDLPAGDYRLVIYPEGQDALELPLAVSEGSEVLTLQVDDPSGTPDPTSEPTGTATTEPTATATSPGENPTATATEVSTVAALPATGTGESGPSGMVLASMMAIGTLLVVMSVGIRRQTRR